MTLSSCFTLFPLDASIDLDENGTKLFDFVIGMTPAVPLSTIALVVAADMPITRAYPDSPSVRKPHNGHARTWLRVLRDFDDSYLKVTAFYYDFKLHSNAVVLGGGNDSRLGLV